MAATDASSEGALMDRIEAALDSRPDRPFCVHRLYEEFVSDPERQNRDDGLRVTERAADELMTKGRAQRELVSTTTIGVHCHDSLYWSSRSQKRRLEEFGPEYESPTILRRLASHIQCHGL